MSVHLEVFLRRDRLPTRDRWQAAIDAAGIDLHLDSADTTLHTGFWPARLSKKNCGFEYSFGPVDLGNDEGAEKLDPIVVAIGDRDSQVSFIFHSSRDDCEAAALAGAVLAKMTDGVFLDPQSGEFAIGAEAFSLIKRQEDEDKNSRMQDAIRRWGSITERRCPQCGAPCPEFRPTCKVCQFAIGRA